MKGITNVIPSGPFWDADISFWLRPNQKLKEKIGSQIRQTLFAESNKYAYFDSSSK